VSSKDSSEKGGQPGIGALKKCWLKTGKVTTVCTVLYFLHFKKMQLRRADDSVLEEKKQCV